MHGFCKLYLSFGTLFFACPVFAYLDPASGSMLLSLVVTVFATLFFSVKGIYYKLSTLAGYKRGSRKKYGIVFYSEGKQYWSTFKPVLAALDNRNINCTYLSSDKNDQGLSYQSENVETIYIGQGNKAYFQLNTLEADICIMTTPGLDVLQIKRSKGVRHYSHLIHSPIDVGKYKLFSFDYFDSILCSGEHQIRSLRQLEKLRRTPVKTLLKTGCTYMDLLAERHEISQVQNINVKNTILIAPSWGVNGSLNRFGADLIEPLLKSHFNVIVRPHPQSLIVEKEMIDAIKERLSAYPNLSWDFTADSFESMNNSNLMISDMSGAIFDYCFVFEKPVITTKFEYDLRGSDANGLPQKAWELTVLSKIGIQVGEDEIPDLPVLADEVLNIGSDKQVFKKLRDDSLFNFRKSGEVAADQIMTLYQEITRKEDAEIVLTRDPV